MDLSAQNFTSVVSVTDSSLGRRFLGSTSPVLSIDTRSVLGAGEGEIRLLVNHF